MPKKPQSPADYIVPLNINGLEGRMLHMPAPKDKHSEILFVYGHHSSLERWWGLMQVLNRYAAVTLPDLPGFGGMDSFYKIGQKPTIDNFADYLAAFMKLRYKRKKVIIVGMSYGFVIATRMLQRYPELTKRVTLLVSLVGFAHKDDFKFSKPRYHTYLNGARVLRHRPFSTFFRYVVLHPRLIRAAYARTNNAKHKFAHVQAKDELEELLEIEIGLWHGNHVRTYMFTTAEFLRLDNCKVRIDLPVWHIYAKADHFFDNNVVEQHIRVIYKDFHSAEVDATNHAPSVLADERAAADMIPPKLRRVLRSL